MNKNELDQLKNAVLKQRNEPLVANFENSYEWMNNKDRLIRYSLQGKNVLVVGSEAILCKNYSSDYKDSDILNRANGDTEQLLLEYLKKSNKRLYAGIEHLSEAQDFPSLPRDIDSVLREKDRLWKEMALKLLEPSLRLLLESKCFRLVITTSFDPILEYALLKIWGTDLRIKNIHDDVDMSNTDIMTEPNRKSEFYDINPTLFYAFGKAVAGANKMYAITDDKKVYTIDCWLAARKPNNLLQYIINKDILAVGCKFENWVFRFFWYLLGQKPSLASSNSFNETSCKKGSVAIMLSDENNEEEKTKSFIVSMQPITYFEDSRAFMNLLAPELVPDIPPQVGDFFISYASEDFGTANIIYDFLKSKRQNVWFDIRLKAGDWFNEEIDKGIEQCSVFMPILSNQTKEDLINHHERYYQKEWKKADSKVKRGAKDFLVIPVVIEEYSVKDASYHNAELVTDCIKNATCFSAKENSSLLQLLNEVNDQKIRKDTNAHH